MSDSASRGPVYAGTIQGRCVHARYWYNYGIVVNPYRDQSELLVSEPWQTVKLSGLKARPDLNGEVGLVRRCRLNTSG